jgi:hypothetical protein
MSLRDKQQPGKSFVHVVFVSAYPLLTEALIIIKQRLCALLNSYFCYNIKYYFIAIPIRLLNL